ncbi:hypothetical protein [Mucilaginibacter jinjuensis]|uniref:Uncharacterized protein n=1 Tax=Mucilaginibacter jinjuensis TaxID=1176721 RepID=A0ABY7TB16_9SPHI|nr:hypothetical protein [Mucilaginibacter jinjuensis]WCT13389.1 hypothetical protein PQO05_05505 [Mucilaginibacter jinjuensis]
MRVRELFEKLGLSANHISAKAMHIKEHNLTANIVVPTIELNASIDTLTMSQTPFIGWALGQERGIEFLDEEHLQPLSIAVNAMRYAALEMDQYFGNEMAD